MKLWHLWLRTSCCYPCSWQIVLISMRHLSPHHHHHWLQRSLLHQRFLKTISLTGSLSIDLQDFNIHWQITLATWMAPADTLSERPYCHHLRQHRCCFLSLTLWLSAHLTSHSLTISSRSLPPIPLSWEQFRLFRTVPPLFPCSTLSDWTFDDGHYPLWGMGIHEGIVRISKHRWQWS